MAIKVLEKHSSIGSTSLNRVLAEREILSFLDHPNVVTLHFAFQDETRIFFVMDFMGGGDLYKTLKRFPGRKLPEPTAAFYTGEVLLALEYLHSYDIVFRDLKPENLLLSAEGHLKVTDFGLGKVQYLIWYDYFNLAQILMLLIVLGERRGRGACSSSQGT